MTLYSTKLSGNFELTLVVYMYHVDPRKLDKPIGILVRSSCCDFATL